MYWLELVLGIIAMILIPLTMGVAFKWLSEGNPARAGFNFGLVIVNCFTLFTIITEN